MAVTKKTLSDNNSVTLILSGYTPLDYTRKVYCWIRYDGRTEWVNMKTEYLYPEMTEVSFWYRGLDPGTTYYLKATMVGQNTSYDYGPFTVKTTGTSYTEMTGNCSITSNGTYASIALTGVNKQAGYTRTVKLYYKKPNGTYVLSDTKTISGSSTQSNFYYYIFGLEEKTDYIIKVEVINPSGGIIRSWEQNVTTWYDSGGSLAVSDVTEKSCTLTVSNIPVSTKYPRTLTWYGKEGEDGAWELLTTTSAYGDNTYTLNSLIPSTYYGFKVDVSAGGERIGTLTASCTTPEAAGTLTEQSTTEYSSQVLLSGLATGVSYVRKIKWFYRMSTEDSYTEFEKESTLSQYSSSAAMVIDTLASGTTYSIKAEIYSTDGKLLGTKTLIVTTKETVADISFESVTSASIKITISGMNNASYARTFEWFYKRQADANYVQFDESSLPATDETGKISKAIKPLIAKTWYDFKVRIKKDKAVMKELLISARTAIDNEIVPETEIESMRDEIGSKAVKVYWDAPEHQSGFKYQIQYSLDNESFLDVGSVLTSPPAAYTEITLPTLDQLYHIRVHSFYEIDGEIASKYCASMPVYLYSKFSWDTEKVSGGAFLLSASEWNRLIRTIRTHLNNEGIDDDFEMTEAILGKPVTAMQYNQVCEAICAFNPFTYAEQSEGNAITAEMLNAVVSKLNMEGAEQ